MVLICGSSFRTSQNHPSYGCSMAGSRMRMYRVRVIDHSQRYTLAPPHGRCILMFPIQVLITTGPFHFDILDSHETNRGAPWDLAQRQGA